MRDLSAVGYRPADPRYHELLDRVMAPGFRCHDQWEVQIQAQLQLKATVHVYAGGLGDEELRRALLVPCRSVEETVAQVRRQRPDATIAVLPDGPQVVPYVFPQSCQAFDPPYVLDPGKILP